MAIKVTSIQFDSTLDNSGYSDFLTGNIGDALKIKVNFFIENTNVASADNTIILAPVNENTLDVDTLIFCENTEFVSGLKVGDELNLVDVTSPSTTIDCIVTEIIDSQTFRTDETFSNATKTSGSIINVTNRKGLRYYYNFVENGNNFESLTDPNELQLFTFNNLDYTSSTVENLKTTGQKTWQIGSVTIEPLGIVDGKISYELIHNTFITPLHLANQLNDTENGIRPSYFKGGSTLNYICQIDLCRNLLDVNNFETVQSSVIGNVGWFNENFNGLQSNYTLNGIIYSNTINALDLNVNTEVVISIDCTDASFTTSTKVNLGFIYLPGNESDYQENNRLLTDNFCFDSKIVVTNNTPSNGANFGNSKQVIKDVKSSFIDSSTIWVTANIELGSDYKTIINESDFKNYLLFVSVENIANDFDAKDRVNLIGDVNKFAIELADIELVKNEGTFFIEHPYDTRSFGVSTLDIQPVDDVVCNSEFYIDFTDLENDNVLIKSVTPSLRLKKSGQSDVILESNAINVDNSQIIIDGLYNIQNINFAQGREFKIPIEEIRKYITFSRNINNDSGNKRYYSLNYPFMMRWEYWKQLLLATYSKDFFANLQDFQGYNHNWTRLANVLGWSFIYQIDFVIERLGVLYNQTFTKSIVSKDFDSNTDWTTTIVSSGLENGGVKLIKGYEQTEITATFEKVTGTIPDVSAVAIVLWIETFESGGITDIRRISSVHDNDSQSWFIENLVDITSPSSGVFVGTCNIDNTKLPSNNKYTIYARIYELNVIEDNVRITNDDIIRETIDNFNRITND
jgi:hypothetical protein